MRAAGVALCVLALLAACDDMTDQPRQKTYSPEVAPARQPKGVVEYDKAPPAAPPLTLALLERGQARFRIYCTPCHSELGDGDGMVVQRGFPRPPSYHSAALIAAPTRHFYDVITNGFGVMYSYADRVQPSDRWAIAAYIRALQRSQAVPVAELTPDERKSLP
ncbi:MAG: c-type cytochrome [Gemmatimonadaceae bacterium]